MRTFQVKPRFMSSSEVYILNVQHISENNNGYYNELRDEAFINTKKKKKYGLNPISLEY